MTWTTVSTLEMDALTDLLPEADLELIPLALAKGYDGRNWLIDRDGTAREIRANDETEAAVYARAPDRSRKLVAVPVGLLRRLPIDSRVDVRAFVVDPPDEERTRTIFGSIVYFQQGVDWCVDLLTGRNEHRLH